MQKEEITMKIEEMRQLMYRGRRSGINSGTALIVWGVIALIAIEVSPLFLKKGWFRSAEKAVLVLAVFYLLLFSAGIAIDHVLTKRKVEELGEMLDYTSRQIGKMWAFLPLFGGYLTVVLALYGAYSYIYPVWMMLVGAGMYFTGAFSLRYYEWYGLLLMIAGIASSLIPEGYGYQAAKLSAEIFLGAGLIVSGIYVKRRYGW
ncbi:MAG: hypothetical protein GXO97_09375 [Nitrospirae bacterium]|nr:hypothetical protein [Nitrospirota bacterium]